MRRRSDPPGVGVIGCGEISTRYLRELSAATGLRLVGCASRTHEAAVRQARTFGVAAMSAEELLAKEEVALVVNLTSPAAHAEITRKALLAGKHVYSEKPLAQSLDEGRDLIALADRLGLSLACAPATSLGPAQQTFRRALDAGALGTVTLASASIVYGGPDLWRRNPERLFAADVGPLRDMGVYQVNALVNLFGPVKALFALGGRGRLVRTAVHSDAGDPGFPVETPTHVVALLAFAADVHAKLTVSFDAPASRDPGLEIQGVQAVLAGPGASLFAGELRSARALGAWESFPLHLEGWAEDLWLIGVFEQLEALEVGRPPRASAQVALHVLEVLEAIAASISTREPQALTSSCERPEPLDMGDYERFRRTYAVKGARA